jgi:hypothetical protein
LETILFIPPNTKPPAREGMADCRCCGTAISKAAAICPACGNIPSLWRLGWYSFIVLGVIGIIDGVLFIILNALLMAFK